MNSSETPQKHIFKEKEAANIAGLAQKISKLELNGFTQFNFANEQFEQPAGGLQEQSKYLPMPGDLNWYYPGSTVYDQQMIE